MKKGSMKTVLQFFILLCMIQAASFGQTIKLSGVIWDEEGQPLEGVVIADSLGHVLSQSTQNGIFSLEIQPNQQICFRKPGYIDTCLAYSDSKDQNRIVLRLKSTQMNAVIVSGQGMRIKSLESTKVGVTEIRVDSIRQLPTLTGEVDPLKILQLTPGVGKFDLSSGLLVRGSTIDQNLVIFDEGMIYNPTHLAGFISMFNPYVVEKITLIKTGLPVDYGGRTSSMLLAESGKNPSSNRIEGNVGLLLSNVAVHRSLGNRCWSTVAFRRSYIDYTLKPFSKQFFPNSRSFFQSSSYNFYDGNFIVNYRLTQQDNIILSTYLGSDNFTLNRTAFELKYDMEWNNKMASMQWTHHFNARHSSKTSAYFTKSNLRLFIGQSNFNYRLISTNEDYSIKHEHRFYINRFKIKIGGQYLQQWVIPNRSAAVLNELQANFGTPNEYHLSTLSGYAESEIAFSNRFLVSVGIRENVYTHLGPYSQFVRSADTRVITDTLYYPYGSVVKKFNTLDLQLLLRYKIDSLSALKLNVGRNNQFVQQVNVTTVALPTDFWLPASHQVPPLVAQQMSIGYYRNWYSNINLSVEMYYKWFNPVIEFDKGLLQSLSKATMEENILLGKGRSYGIELYVEGSLERWAGWISYTLSRSERVFAEINQGRPFPSKYDRLHDLTVVLMRSINFHWKGSLTFTYASGQATTLPVGRYLVGGNIVNQYTAYNGFRMPPYHRLDIAFSRILKSYRGMNHELVFSIYNVYSRLNPYFMYYKVSGDLKRYKLTVTPQYVALFPMMPSISYRFSY